MSSVWLVKLLSVGVTVWHGDRLWYFENIRVNTDLAVRQFVTLSSGPSSAQRKVLFGAYPIYLFCILQIFTENCTVICPRCDMTTEGCATNGNCQDMWRRSSNNRLQAAFTWATHSPNETLLNIVSCIRRLKGSRRPSGVPMLRAVGPRRRRECGQSQTHCDLVYLSLVWCISNYSRKLLQMFFP